MTVALLPGLFGEPVDWSAAEAAARRLGHDVLVVLTPDPGSPHAQRWVATIARALHADTTPTVLIATGQAGALLPLLGVVQRARRRRTLGYGFVDATVPRAAATIGELLPVTLVTDGADEPVRPPPDWPDAPCAYATTGSRDDAEERLARLRGWPIIVATDVATAVTDVLRTLVPDVG